MQSKANVNPMVNGHYLSIFRSSFFVTHKILHLIEDVDDEEFRSFRFLFECFCSGFSHHHLSRPIRDGNWETQLESNLM